MSEPNVLTRMRLSCCWGDNLNEKELNEVVDYINYLQRELIDCKKRNERVSKIIGECLELFPHEFDWGEQMEFAKEILDKKDSIVTINRDMTHFFDGVAELDTTPLLSSEEILKIIKEEERNRKNVDNTHI